MLGTSCSRAYRHSVPANRLSCGSSYFRIHRISVSEDEVGLLRYLPLTCNRLLITRSWNNAENTADGRQFLSRMSHRDEYHNNPSACSSVRANESATTICLKSHMLNKNHLVMHCRRDEKTAFLVKLEGPIFASTPRTALLNDRR